MPSTPATFKHVPAGIITEKQRKFCEELVIDGDQKRAAIAAGVPEKSAASLASQWLTQPKWAHVRKLYERLRHECELRSAKTADDIRLYIHTLMYFEPLRFFMPGDGGGWLIEEEQWHTLPPYVGCLIEAIERRETTIELPDGKKVTKVRFWVKLVSKTKAMELAAKHQLGEKINLSGTIMQVNWDDLAKRGARIAADGRVEETLGKSIHPIEAKIESVKQLPKPNGQKE